MNRGFTLIELLVALALLGIVAVLSYRGVDSMRRADQRMAAEAQRWQAIARFFDRFQMDVQQVSQRPRRLGDGTLDPAWHGQMAADGAALLALTRKPVAPGQDEERVGYRLRGDRLELLLWPGIDAGPQDAPRVYTLLPGVTALSLSYLGSDYTWVDQWPPEGPAWSTRHPRAVNIWLRLADGSKLLRTFALP